MKYIVVYIILILLALPSGMTAQKQCIDLLPSAGHQAPPEILNDTASVVDSVVVIPVEQELPAAKRTDPAEKDRRKPKAVFFSGQHVPERKMLIRGIIQPVWIIKMVGILILVTEFKS